jgi:hypothetical protein
LRIGGGLDVSKASSDKTNLPVGGGGIGGIGIGDAVDNPKAPAGASGPSGVKAGDIASSGAISGLGPGNEASVMVPAISGGGAAGSGSSAGSGASGVAADTSGIAAVGNDVGGAGTMVAPGNRIGSASDAAGSGSGAAGAATAGAGVAADAGSSTFAGSLVRAARWLCPSCAKAMIATVVAAAVAAPAIAGVSNGVGRDFGPSAAIAANSPATMKMPSPTLPNVAALTFRPANSTTNAMQITTATASTRETIKARIDSS